MKKLLFICFILVLTACATMQRQRQQFVKSNSGLTAEQRDAILKGNLIIGMTRDMVAASWGEPVDIINEIINGQQTVSWVYQFSSDSRINTYRMRFDNIGHLREVKLINVRERVYSPYSRHHYWRHFPEYP